MKDVEMLLKELTLEEKASLCSGLDVWYTKPVERLGIPSVMLCDGPNGLRKQEGEADHLGIHESKKEVCFPTSATIACSFDPEVARLAGKTIGRECQAEDVAMILGPGANIKRSPLCGRNFEYYSEDPCLSSELAASFVEGVQGEGISVCLKHFACNNHETRRMNADAVVDERTLNEIYLASFEKAVKEAHCHGVMCSYNRINGVYSAENEWLLTEVLRKRWGFDGLVVTDWGAVKDRVKGILAGLDLEMPGNPGALANDQKIVEAVKNGSLAEEKLDEAVKNVLTFVKRSVESAREEPLDRAADYQTAVQLAKECAVLLKNDGTLPLDKNAEIAFIGEFAEHPRYQGGGSSHINSAYVPSVAELIGERENIRYAKGFSIRSEKVDEALEEEALALAKTSEVSVVFAGLPERYEGEGFDRTHLDMPSNQAHLITRLLDAGCRVVVVLHHGSAVAIPYAEQVNAILDMILGGDGVSEATLSLLFGESCPSGKLAESFPLRLEDNPSFLNFPGEYGVSHYREGIFVGYRYYDKKKTEVLYPFGHGLSYTDFVYSDLELSAEEITDDETLTVRMTVKNVGTYRGKEAIQLYVGEDHPKIIRPVKELRAFCKTELQPGESKKVEFVLDRRAFAYYDVKAHDFLVPPGEYTIFIGSSSRDLRLTGKVLVRSSHFAPMTVTPHTSLCDLRDHPATRGFVEDMLAKASAARHGGKQPAETDYGMGEGAKAMIDAMIDEMTLCTIAGYMGLGDEQLNGLIAMLQGMIDGMTPPRFQKQE